MHPAIEHLQVAIDELASVDVRGMSQRDDVAELWRQMARLDAQFARRVAELDHSAEWSVDGSRSAPGWLVANVRTASGEAHHRVKVAREVAQMPVTAAAWERGAVSSRHVDALTRVRHAAKAPAEFAVFEPVLVDVALDGRPEDVAGVGRQWRDALDSHLDRDHVDPRANYGVHFSRSIEGAGFLDGTFDTEGAEIIGTALDRFYDRHHTADDPRCPAQQRADALVEICRRALDDQPRGANRPHIIVPVDAATLSGEAVGLCETISGYRISPETARRLACDAIVQRIVIDSDGVPLDMGRATRTFTPDQNRAIMMRDGGCRMPGCDVGPDHCEAHHACVHWEAGGDTDLANGLAVCRGSGHHRLLHEGGWTVVGDPNGEVSFFDNDGIFRGSSRPRRPPGLMLTRAGDDVERARTRATLLPAARVAA